MIFKCDECGSKCVLKLCKAISNPKNCLFKDGDIIPKWKETDEYDIIAKNKPDSQTPNCAICKWIKSDYKPIIYKVNADEADKIIKGDFVGCPTNYDCMAQGGADAYGVYNSDQCKSLFEVKTTEDKE